MTRHTIACAAALIAVAGAGHAPSAPAAVQPRITSASVGVAGHNPGADYFVTVTVRARVCAAKGPVTLRVREQLNLGGDTISEHFRRYAARNSARCQTHRIVYKLGDAFFGIGTYQVRLQASDRFGRRSRSVFRTHDTND